MNNELEHPRTTKADTSQNSTSPTVVLDPLMVNPTTGQNPQQASAPAQSVAGAADEVSATAVTPRVNLKQTPKDPHNQSKSGTCAQMSSNKKRCMRVRAMRFVLALSLIHISEPTRPY